MATDLNKVILIGRLVRDPDTKQTASGTTVCNFSIANGRTYVQNGEKKEQTSFFNCIAWSKLGEVINQYCKKGQRIGIEGKLQQRSWETDSGEKRSVVEVVVDNFQFLESKGDNQQKSEPKKDEPVFSDNPFSDDLIPF